MVAARRPWVRIIFLFFILASCTSIRFTKPGIPNADLRHRFSAIATDDELKAFDEAVRSGPDSLTTWLDHYWDDHDPTPGTRTNEYEDRFLYRSDEYLNSVAERNDHSFDDRLLAYIRFGVPSEIEDYQHIQAGTWKGWIYTPDTDVTLAGFEHPLLDKLKYAASFKLDKDGRFVLKPKVLYPWALFPKQLSAKEINELETILLDEESGRYLRAAAAWRLAADPAPRAMAALLQATAIQDNYVNRIIADAVAPHNVYPVQSGGFDRGREITPPDPILVGQEVLRLYDPRRTLAPDVVTSLASKRAAGDSAMAGFDLWEQPVIRDEYRAYLDGPWSMLEQGDFEGAHTLLDPLLKLELLRVPEAWYLDALALMEIPDPAARRLAEERVRQAIRLSQDDMRYRLTLAQILYRRTLTVMAEGALNQILKDIPNSADALALKARMRLQAWWALGWHAGGFGSPVSERKMEPEVALQEALNYLNEALVLDPDNSMATWWLGLHFLLTEEWASAAQVMNYIVGHGVHTAEALLGRGLALQHLGFLEEAWRNYQAGILTLPEKVQKIAMDPRLILPPSAGGIQHRGRGADRLSLPARSDTTETGIAQASADTFFWRSRDPLFSTEVNERMLEHFRRFAYVSWIFASENLGLKGWDTLRGQIYLRYGAPRSMSNQRGAIQNMMAGRITAGGSGGMAGSAEMRAMTDAMLTPKEYWRYEDFTFAFGTGFLSGNLSLGPAPRYPGGPDYIDTQREFRELLETTPESPKVEGSIDVLPLEATWYRFQSPSGDAEFIPVIHFLNLPGELLRSTVRTVKYPLEFMLLDDTWSVVESRREEVTVTRWSSRRRRFAVGPLLSPTGESQPDRLTYGAIEHLPADRNIAYASRDTLDRPLGSSLELSSLIVANHVDASDQSTVWPEGSFITRKDISVIVRPTNHFSLNEPVYLYFEIYGLGRDEFGATSYELELTVEASRSNRPVSAIVRFARALIDQEAAQQGRVTLVTQRAGISTDAQEYLRIAFPVGQQADVFIVTVGVNDLVTDQRSERTIRVLMGG